MESRSRRLRNLFICILGTAIIFLVSFDERLSVWYGSAQRMAPSSITTRHRWEDPGPYHVAYPRNYTFIMDDVPACKTKTPFLILMVPIAPGDVATRGAIRKTWGSEKLVLGQVVEILFVLGLPGGADADQRQEELQEENLQHHDLIQSNFQDSYHNLTIKTMIMLEWLALHCSKASYAMKVDSDVFLHVRNLVKLLLHPGTAKRDYVTGLVWWHSPVVRNPFIRFYLPRQVFPEPEFPPYPLGLAYVMSMDLPAKILLISSHIRPLYIEDAYLGLCLKRLGISPSDPPENAMFMLTPNEPPTVCSLSRVIAFATTSITQMITYWQKSKHPDVVC